IFKRVQEQSGAKILLGLKGFAMWALAKQIRTALPGVSVASVNEAKLAAEHFGGEAHACGPAYSDDDFRELLQLCDHIVFNSLTQKARLMPLYHAHRAAGGREIEFGVRLNPMHREAKVALYDPAAPGSRLGITKQALEGADLSDLAGLHFHTLCQVGPDALERTLQAVEAQFGDHIRKMKWMNFGGGHHITMPDYDTEKLVALIKSFQDRYGVQVYLEPGEAIAIRTGVLVASVLDIVENDGLNAILDASATAHMPDVLEMPYRPDVQGAHHPGEKPHTYRLGGPTCLAGDVIGTYSFDAPLKIGDKIILKDMSHYTMVKTTTFNGVRHPSIATADPKTGAIHVVRKFGYEDYRDRLS
nr:carboxynorspermidine decarboxylase [Terricaulis sp.]